MTVTVAKAPCKSCPYRCDVPSGVWAQHEYEKLPKYDGEIGEQVMNGAWGLFNCHQRDGNLCAGWLACHGADNLLAMRMTGEEIAPEVWAYESPVPIFDSGREAAEHGMRDIENPGVWAQSTINRLMRKLERD
jgi:hypothetical protein